MTPLEALVERLEVERASGMPRWQVHPQVVVTDPLPVVAARRRELQAAVSTAEPSRRRRAA